MTKHEGRGILKCFAFLRIFSRRKGNNVLVTILYLADMTSRAMVLRLRFFHSCLLVKETKINDLCEICDLMTNYHTSGHFRTERWALAACVMERVAEAFRWSWAQEDVCQVFHPLGFSKATSACNLLFCTVEMEEWKHLEAGSGVVNSFTRVFRQNGIVVWPGDKKHLQNEDILFSLSSYDFLACSWLHAASYENFFYSFFCSFLENFCSFSLWPLPSLSGFLGAQWGKIGAKSTHLFVIYLMITFLKKLTGLSITKQQISVG